MNFEDAIDFEFYLGLGYGLFLNCDNEYKVGNGVGDGVGYGNYCNGGGRGGGY